MYLEGGDRDLDGGEQVALCELLDRVLNKGVVVIGQVTISVADVDLIYLGLQLVLTSMETAGQSFRHGCPGGAALKIDIGREKRTSGLPGADPRGV